MDANNCTDTSFITLSGVDSLFLVDLITENTSCGEDNGQINFSGIGGTPSYQYSIDNGTSYSSSSLHTDLSPGTYQLIVLDNAGCADSSDLVISPSSNPVIDSLNVTVDFCDLSNGTLNSYASLGITPYTYTIFQGTDTLMLNMTGSFDSLASGSYELYVTDSANLRIFSIYN